jgi:uncharacterized membrane protein YhaH (DUF805 family)
LLASAGSSILDSPCDREDRATSFGEAIQTVLRKYAEFNGRATRSEFWWWMLFDLLVTGALDLFRVFEIGDTSSLGSLLVGLWSIAVLLPTLAVAVRRLRDAGHDWANLFWILVPIAGLVIVIVYWAQPSTAATSEASAAAA